MQVDEVTSEEESEEEVRCPEDCPFWDTQFFIARRVLLARVAGASRGTKTHRGILSSQVGFPLPIVRLDTTRCLLPSSVSVFPYRAQKRIAQQQIGSKMPLGRIIDIRKKVFAEVKVCRHFPKLYAL